MIYVKNLKKKYGSYTAIDDISFNVKKGEVFGFLGKNGAGKSTTMNILNGLIKHDVGEVKVEGSVGYLPESPAFYDYMNAKEYLKFMGEIIGYNKKNIEKRIDEILEVIDLTYASKKKIGGYSRGMKQRIGLGVAIFDNPDIVFLDEPTSALDPKGRLDMIKIIERLKSEGKTVFLSSHILNDVERVCDNICILDGGKIILNDSLEKIEEKYIQPIFDIELEKEVENLEKYFKSLEGLQNIKVDGKIMSLYVNNKKIFGNKVYAAISEMPVQVMSCGFRKSSLEDIFFRMVK